ncbi:haptoglobin-like isoform X2 [Heterodontus francisci]|uniref:haptoglobin-like isoform X2 n=1 Tax=Heterodontus francisci TaxID=7792 RepID=UPI00355BE852
MWLILLQAILLGTLSISSADISITNYAHVHCGVPENITHGHYEYLTHQEDDTYLSVIRYSCDGPTYHLEDPEEAVYVCTLHNKWKNSKLFYKLPTCHKVSCPAPSDIEHGHFEYMSTFGITTYLSAIKYTCDANYHESDFSDEGVYICTIEGKWRNTDLDYEFPVCEPVECGKPIESMDVHQRIVGGSLAVHGDSPWSVRLQYQDEDLSNGALIDHHWVLTSAHALHAHKKEELLAHLKVYLGVEDERAIKATTAMHVEDVVWHSRLRDAVEYRNDLALVKLKEEVSYNNHIMPICLPEHDYTEQGQVGFVAGWGKGETEAPAAHLRYVALPVANTTECQAYFAENHPQFFPDDFPNMFCTEPSATSNNVCKGDWGAAFAVVENGTYYVDGILSYDGPCATEKYGVYTDVFDHLDWIKNTIASH